MLYCAAVRSHRIPPAIFGVAIGKPMADYAYPGASFAALATVHIKLVSSSARSVMDLVVEALGNGNVAYGRASLTTTNGYFPALLVL